MRHPTDTPVSAAPSSAVPSKTNRGASEPKVLFPPELIAAVTRSAEQDADDVAALLDLLGLSGAGPAGRPTPLPPPMLLGLGAAMRLVAWESAGLRLHKDHGLPSGRDALRLVFDSFVLRPGPERGEAVVRSLCVEVLKLSITQLAWDGPTVLGGEVVLGEASEEALINALAQLAWGLRCSERRNADVEGA